MAGEPNPAPAPCPLATRLIYCTMISDREIWQAAGGMIKRYGADAASEAAMRADEMLDDGDIDGCAVWRRIMLAVEGLSGMEPGGEVN